MQKEHGEPYDIYIDIFAGISGELTWDSDFLVDKNVSQQQLFTIQNEKETHVQYLNPADFFFGNFLEEAFDWRVSPVLQCDSRASEIPLGPHDLWGSMASKRRVRSKLGEARTCDLKQLAGKMGYRLVSHQHCPEPLSALSGLTSDLTKNLHTFVRKVGHIIQPEIDRDSKILARLKMALPHHLQQKNVKRKVSLTDTGGFVWRFVLEAAGTISVTKQGAFIRSLSPEYDLTARLGLDRCFTLSLGPGIKVHAPFTQKDQIEALRHLREEADEGAALHQESTSILVIRFNKPGQVVWAPPEEICSWDQPGAVLFVVKFIDSDDMVAVRVPSFDLRFELETVWSLGVCAFLFYSFQFFGTEHLFLDDFSRNRFTCEEFLLLLKKKGRMVVLNDLAG